MLPCNLYSTQSQRPGAVVQLAEHPQDSNRLLIGYASGLLVLWDLRAKAAEARFQYNEVCGQRLWNLNFITKSLSFMNESKVIGLVAKLKTGVKTFSWYNGANYIHWQVEIIRVWSKKCDVVQPSKRSSRWLFRVANWPTPTMKTIPSSLITAVIN